MPERIVDHLEVVEVDEDHRDRTGGALREYRLLQAVVEEVAVGKPGERVVVRMALELFLVALALDRVLHRPEQQVAIDPALHEVVLRAALHRVERERLVVVAREHDDRHLGRVREHFAEGVEAGAVGKREIEEHELGLLEREDFEPAGEPFRHRDVEGRGRILGEHLADEPRVAGVVLDQQDGLSGRFGFHLPGGSVTTVSQKRSIDCTTVMNFSRSTGFVT